MSRSTISVIIGILVALVLLGGLSAAFVWWKVNGLKERLVHDVENAIGATVTVTSMDFDVWKGELHAAGISLVNQRASAPWEKADIAQAAVKFHLSDVLASTLPVSVEVSSWSIVFHARSGTSDSSFTSALPESNPDASPGRVQVTQISARDGSVEIDLSPTRKVSLHGVAFDASNNGAGVWTTQLQATSLQAEPLTATATAVQILGQGDKITFSNLHMQCDPGGITGDGEVYLGGMHDARVNLKAVDVPLTMLVAVEWQMKLSGLVSGDLHYDGNDQSGDAKGQFLVNHGKFNVLPWMGKITSMVGLQDISDVEVDKATSDFEWKDQALHLTNLDVRKNDVTRIGGNVNVDATGQVDGKLKLGLPSTVTSKWPQLQDKIFTEQHDDFNWTDVHVTGTSDHLQEDLTSRLLAVSIGQGSDLLNQATQKATDLFNSFLGTTPAPASTSAPSPSPTPAPPAPVPAPQH